MSEPTHNAGEKCPTCGNPLRMVTKSAMSYLNDDQFDSVRAGDWYCETCPSNNRGNTNFKYFWNRELTGQGTGLKPAVESPAAEVKEREVEPKYQHPTTLLEFEAVYRLEYQQELEFADRWIKWCEKHKDTHGMNFNQGLKSSAIFHNQKMEQLIRVLKQEEPNINTKLAAKDSQISDLTTKLAALQVEKQADMRSFNEGAKFSVDMIAKQGEIITTLRATLKNGGDTTYTIDIAPKDGTPIIGIYDNGEECEIEWSEQRQCMLAGVGGGNGYFGCGWQDTYNKLIVDTPLCWKPSPNAVRHSASELAVLKRENDRLNIINNGMMDNLKLWQSANAVFDKELTTLRAENQVLKSCQMTEQMVSDYKNEMEDVRNENIKLKQCVDESVKENQGLVKEVERLRELLTIIGEQLECPSRNTTMTSYRRDGSVIISNDIRLKVKEALKPTPEESGSKRNP